VTAVVYQGAYRRVEFRCDNGVTGSAMEQAGADTAAGTGDRIAVGWSVDDAVLLPADPAPTEPATVTESAADLRERQEA
jgi:hypothetical protein